MLLRRISYLKESKVFRNNILIENEIAKAFENMQKNDEYGA